MVKTIQVDEDMYNFVQWANDKGKDEIDRIVREKLYELKEEYEKNQNVANADGFKWDPILEPSDRVDQWKGGGDCNRCRRASYCKKQCRANRKLKEIMTPYLYSLYVEDHPEMVTKAAAKAMTPDMMLQAVGVNNQETGLEYEEKPVS